MTYIAQNDNEYWEERELMNVLEYKEWRNFEKIISKAMIACNISKNKTSDHFVDINKMVMHIKSTGFARGFGFLNGIIEIAPLGIFQRKL